MHLNLKESNGNKAIYVESYDRNSSKTILIVTGVFIMIEGEQNETTAKTLNSQEAFMLFFLFPFLNRYWHEKV